MFPSQKATRKACLLTIVRHLLLINVYPHSSARNSQTHDQPDGTSACPRVGHKDEHTCATLSHQATTSGSNRLTSQNSCSHTPRIPPTPTPPAQYSSLTGVLNAQAQNRHYHATVPSSSVENNSPAYFSQSRQVPTVDVRKLKDLRAEERKRKRDSQASSTQLIPNSGFSDTRTIYSVNRQRNSNTASTSVASAHDARTVSGQTPCNTTSDRRDSCRDTPVDGQSLELHNTTPRTPLLPHEKLKRNLRSISGLARQKVLNGFNVSKPERRTIPLTPYPAGSYEDVLEEIDVLGTLAQRPFLVDLGQWSRYQPAEGTGLVDEEVRETVEEWRAQVASSTSSSDMVRVSPSVAT